MGGGARHSNPRAQIIVSEPKLPNSANNSSIDGVMELTRQRLRVPVLRPRISKSLLLIRRAARLGGGRGGEWRVRARSIDFEAGSAAGRPLLPLVLLDSRAPVHSQAAGRSCSPVVSV